jgi:acyl carrier protein
MTALPATGLPERETLISDLKAMIVQECDKDMDPSSIPDDMPLIGEGLELDSLDALQISLAVKERYKVRIEGGPDGRRAMASTAALADFILEARAAAE